MEQHGMTNSLCGVVFVSNELILFHCMCILQDALLSFERMLNETKSARAIDYHDNKQINRGITCTVSLKKIFNIPYIKSNNQRNE